ncbi:MAG: cation:proton antiporter [Acidiferrobacteraceae bacterium]|jgi:multicomponent Na+:H+ antiporter subunit D|nr:cation:proton antiporter [Acidiferrobacteraceae bacterium]MCP4828178.1 monovalent cation/H+ antiporter subunit D family protein [Pseudomonadota bacterium]MDP6950956.1 monovalent cation/H+ antiporter subunit D family protein [Arenicellales bacterium]HJP06474.1 monovalent cation/H+ antiporter subunit D family protein [Arenicellales bacterium]|tara:strand:+ start:5815 stop:7269 length:1455 start_codon:yes stop_codon:yes gene_type:complete
MSDPLLLVLIVLTPLIGAILVIITGRWPNLREAVSLATGAILVTEVALLAPAVLAGETPGVLLAIPVPGVPLALQLEPLGLLFALIASTLWIVTTIYAIGYMRGHGESHQTRFYAFFAIAISATMGVALAQNLFTLFLFYELLTVSTYPLVTHAGTDEARRGGRVYLGILMGTSMGFLLLAVIWTWQLTGTTGFKAGGILAGQASPLIIGILYALFAFGIGKAALMPFHRWLPAAMVAPTPVSALLHAVAVVKAGVFAILKITVYVFGIDLLADNRASSLILWVAAITIIGASLVALNQDNLKRRLAYSTISQLSYVVLGAVLANAAGITGAAVHIATHAVGKITLFFCAGAILVAAHKTRVSELDGLGRQMPVTMGAFLIASLSIAGLPPMAGLWGKWYLAIGAFDAGYGVLVGILMLSTLLNLAYLLPIPLRAFFANAPQRDTQLKEAPLPCLIGIGLTTTACVVLFFFPGPIYRLASMLVL